MQTSFTARIADQCGTAFGIDVSRESIALAQSRSQQKQNVSFSCTSVEEFSLSMSARFNAIVANMMLMTVPDLDVTIHAITRLLCAGGWLIVTIPHPCFWPIYWQYDQENWFDYGAEIFIEAPFSISIDGPSEFITTHVHRPLEKYFSVLLANGLCVQSFAEPLPPEGLDPAYLGRWRHPHFVLIVCTSS